MLEVALLARHLHWSRAEILALPASEFKTLLSIVIEANREEQP